MDSKVKYIKSRIDDMKYSIGLLEKLPCSNKDSENYREILKNGGKLPEKIQQDVQGFFYERYEAPLSESEKNDYIMLKQWKLLNTIKNCAVFFVVISIISVITNLI